MTIKNVLPIPSCSTCGTSLVLPDFHKTHENKLFKQWGRPRPELRICTNCKQITDVSARSIEDHKHAEYHGAGGDPNGQSFLIFLRDD